LLDYYFDGSAEALRSFLAATAVGRRTAAAAGVAKSAPVERLDESLL
jgi:hypothetical protein